MDKENTGLTDQATNGGASVFTIHRQLLQIAADEIARIPEHLEQMTPAERVRFVLAVLPYTAPKVEKVDTDFAAYGNVKIGWPDY